MSGKYNYKNAILAARSVRLVPTKKQVSLAQSVAKTEIEPVTVVVSEPECPKTKKPIK